MYFIDLTNYSYLHYENSKNIGWLDVTFPYSKGKVSDEFIKNLGSYLPILTNMARGYHTCNLCSVPIKGMFTANINKKPIKLGYAEIRVLSEDGNTSYAAPNLIYHYVIGHEYKPPEEFIQAVLKGPKPGSSQYKKYMASFKESGIVEQKIGRHMRITSWGGNDKSIRVTNDFYTAIVDGDLSSIIELYSGCRENVNDIVALDYWLLIASSYGKVDIAKYLLSIGAKVGVSDARSNPLFGAILGGHIEVVKVLVESGIDTSIKYNNEDMYMLDALAFAKERNQKEIIQLLQSL